MQPSRIVVLCWLVVALLAFFREVRADDRISFNAEMAEGLWFLSQYDAFEASQHFERASALRPEDGFSRYLLGLSHLRQGKAREAATEIGASLQARQPPPVKRSRILVDLGAAQLAVGDPQAAVLTLETALRDRKDDAVALYHYANALSLLGRREEAETALASARRLRPDLDPKDLPVELADVMKARSWEGSVGVLAGHDSNPNLLSEDLLLPIPSSNQNPKLVSGRSSDSVASADLRLTHLPIPLGGGWGLAADFREEGSFHQDFQYLNVVRTGAVVHLVHGADPLGGLEGPLGWVQVPQGNSKMSMLLQGGLDELRLDNASYLRLSSLAGSATFSPSAENSTRLDLQLLDRSYYRHPLADPRRNGREVSVGVHEVSYLGGRRDRFVTIGLEASDRNAGSAFSRTLLGGDVEAVLPIAPRWTIRLGAWLNKEKFDDPASNLFSSDPASPERRDRTWGSSATLAFDIKDRLRLLLRGSYQNRDSNVTFDGGLPALDYRRTLLETGLSWSF
jgi:tetratricopeptide (TPR) repeat protein